MAVYMELSQGDTLLIGSSRIRLERKSGQRARLMIESSEDVDRIKAGDTVPKATITHSGTPAASTEQIKPFLQRRIPSG